MTNHVPAEELELLIAVLPRNLQAAVMGHAQHNDLVEIVMDLGRSPEFRTFDSYTVFDHLEVTGSDLNHVIDRIGDFGDDNRAGIARTLHRISAVRNRKGRVIGLTLRVGRAVYGTAEIVRDIIESGRGVLLLGRPGVGKTTMLRETARILADDKRVIIVDTSNEIAGDGDIPHPAIGRARRMQVTTPSMQHEVMIEAVENHNPQVIVIDEIGRELEAQAARTIAERGVQLIGTAHGNTLDNLLMNPTLSDLIGGIESVTLSDEEARRRGTQKSVLERRAPPTFDVLIEIQDWQRLAVHPDVAAAVDGLLRGRPQPAELRYVGDDGETVVERARPAGGGGPSDKRNSRAKDSRPPSRGEPVRVAPDQPSRKLKLFPYGVSQNRLRQSAKSLSLPLILTDDLADADALMTLKSYYRKRPVVINDAETRQIPIYVLRSNTYTQIENALVDMFGLSMEMDEYDVAMQEAREAVQQVTSHTRSMVELSPRAASIRRQQHDMARQANLLSLSRGREPHRRVRIYRKD
ncbi:MAG: R3H domain-containing nucleic acid-binding protein [Anaerolineae bacterium]